MERRKKEVTANAVTFCYLVVALDDCGIRLKESLQVNILYAIVCKFAIVFIRKYEFFQRDGQAIPFSMSFLRPARYKMLYLCIQKLLQIWEIKKGQRNNFVLEWNHSCGSVSHLCRHKQLLVEFATLCVVYQNIDVVSILWH